MTNAPTAKASEPAFRRVPHSGADGGYVRVSEPYTTLTRSTSWQDRPHTEHVTSPGRGSYLIHADKGTYARCPVDGATRNSHYLSHVTVDGVTVHLGSWGIWRAAEMAARVHAGGVDPRSNAGVRDIRARLTEQKGR